MPSIFASPAFASNVEMGETNGVATTTCEAAEEELEAGAMHWYF